MKNTFRKYYIWIIVCILFIVFCMAFFCIQPLSEWFFGQVPMPERIISFVGIACGGIILLLQLNESNKRNKITERGQIDTRFKDAAQLLSNDQTPAIISGIYALHRIAEDVYEADNESQKGYIRIVNDILCAYIKESTEDSNNNGKGAVKVCTRPHIIIQTIIDVLFANQKDIYGEYTSDLGNCLIKDIDLSLSKLSNAHFDKSEIKGCTFKNTVFNNSSFNQAQIINCYFEEAQIDNCQIENAYIIECDWVQLQINNTKLNGSVFANTNVWENIIKSSNLLRTYIYDCEFTENRFNECTFTVSKLENVNFYGSAFICTQFISSKLDRCKFDSASFKQQTTFERATIKDSNFLNTTIDPTVSFNRARINDSTLFDDDFDPGNYSKTIEKENNTTPYDEN